MSQGCNHANPETEMVPCSPPADSTEGEDGQGMRGGAEGE